MPETPDDWASFLLEKTLPSPFQVGKYVLHALKEDQLPYAKLAQQLARDPILSYRILTSANARLPAGKATSKTLDHAISMIGVDELHSLVTKLPFESASSTDIKSYYFVRTLAASLFAAYLGRAICEFKHHPQPEDVFWSCLLLGVPLWLMWRFATVEMRLVRYAIRSNFKLPEVAEREVLGCTFREISEAVSRRLALPDLVKSCYAPGHRPITRQCLLLARSARYEERPAPWDDIHLSIKMHQDTFIVQLANLVANGAAHDWYSRATLRAQRMLASYLNVPLEQAITLTHESAATMSRQHPLPGMMMPAAKLFLPPRPRVKAFDPNKAAAIRAEKVVSPKPESGVAPKPATPTLAPESAETGNIFAELTEIMIKRPEEFSDLHELMNAATQGLAYGIGLKRSVAALVSKDGKRLKSYYSVGCIDHPALAHFETVIVRETLFGKLCERPASVWVKSDSDTKIRGLVPINFKQVIEVDDFFLMSVFIGKKPVAMLYADASRQNKLTEQQYQQFKYLCGAVATTLRYQAEQATQTRD